MKSTVIVFPGSNRDRDMIAALTQLTGQKPDCVWHADTEIGETDLIVLPGGFSYGDYLRAGAIAARSPIIEAVIRKSRHGVPVLGVCNGFQILTETGLLPGALMRNSCLTFVCRTVHLRIERSDTLFTSAYSKGQIIDCPVAHHDGNYFADVQTLDHIEKQGQVVLRYAEGTNPNGSINDIAGICDDTGRILGLMPHPENLISPLHGGRDGCGLFESLLAAC